MFKTLRNSLCSHSLMNSKNIQKSLLEHTGCAEVINMFGKDNIKDTKIIWLQNDYVVIQLDTKSRIGQGYTCYIFVTETKLQHYIDYLSDIKSLSCDKEGIRVKHYTGSSYTLSINELLNKLENGDKL